MSLQTTELNRIKLIIPSLKSETDLQQYDFKLHPFKVPGTLQSNLVAIKHLNPYFEKNMEYFNLFENHCLILFCTLPALEKNKSYCLEFEWIDTNADIYLGGIKIGSAKNAFIKNELPLPNGAGDELLILLLYPHMSYVDKKFFDFPPYSPLDRVSVRRPAYNYGWDFSPRVLLLGIGSVKINEIEEENISDIFVYTEEIWHDRANLEVEWTVYSSSKQACNFKIEIIDLETSNVIYKTGNSQTLIKGKSFFQKKLQLVNPKLWWPNGYGKPSLYQINIIEEDLNLIIKTIFGIRKISLILKENETDSFIFNINGMNIWVKGANWVPTDTLINYADYDRYKAYLNLAREAQFNMVRIWGGGVVENDHFYSICDEFGLMIWHDFQFACSVYPETEDYLKNVAEEIRSIVTRLRNHVSIVLWNGNNENEWINFQNYTSSFRESEKLGEKLHNLKKMICEELDPSRPYWRSSPWSPSSEKNSKIDPNSPHEGNRHNWEVWHGLNQPELTPPEYEHYFKETGKFISEFGIQSLPAKETISSFLGSNNQKSPNEIWKFHNCVIDKLNVNLLKFGIPKEISEYILFSQSAQAFGMKFAINLWRSRKWRMSGSLIWQFNEPWPTISWSLIDYFVRPKMAYWFVKHSFSPVLPVFIKEKNEISVINDTNKIIVGKLQVKEYLIQGFLINETEINLTIEMNSVTHFGFVPQINSEIIFLTLEHNQDKVMNYSLMKDVHNLNIPNPEIKAKFDPILMQLILRSNTVGFIVKIDESVEPTENFLVLIPNDPYHLIIQKKPVNMQIKVCVWNYPEKIVDIEQ